MEVQLDANPTEAQIEENLNPHKRRAQFIQFVQDSQFLNIAEPPFDVTNTYDEMMWALRGTPFTMFRCTDALAEAVLLYRLYSVRNPIAPSPDIPYGTTIRVSYVVNTDADIAPTFAHMLETYPWLRVDAKMVAQTGISYANNIVFEVVSASNIQALRGRTRAAVYFKGLRCSVAEQACITSLMTIANTATYAHDTSFYLTNA